MGEKPAVGRVCPGVDLAHIRADRERVAVYRRGLRYKVDAEFHQGLDEFDAVLARREQSLEVKA